MNNVDINIIICSHFPQIAKAKEIEEHAKKMAQEAENKAQNAAKLQKDLLEAKRRQEAEQRKLQQKLATPPSMHVTEGATDDQEEGQLSGTTDLSMEGVTRVGSEMDRVHIAEKNKAMAAKLKVSGTAGSIKCCMY